ncbi:GTP-binding protein [Chamaesiphon sp. OTE_20_metabat_361]|uniref:CobW family GTP-binding protein n=1 Tax=Chamaesiphon sp. OTE_20_metabat_361 TaxID=2964689 RepID=UPI00286CC799|nr:GTP-binding protein [Chamaesiphon sp. OTE_20_metabat_361]
MVLEVIRPTSTNSNPKQQKIPVTIITGFLGSGKTTLVNHILHEQHGCKIAVIVNEFGEIGIDGQITIADDDEQIVEFNNGCLCCTVRGDLVRTLEELTKRSDLDAVLIETTGLADPAPVASTFIVAEEIKSKFSLDAFVTVVDARNLQQNLKDSHEAQEQIAFADIILINKTDLVTPEDIARIQQQLRELNPIAKVYHTEYSSIDLSLILDTKAFELEAKLEIDPSFLEDLAHEHDASIGSFAVTSDRPIDLNKFMLWMNDLAQSKGEDLYRTKGLFYAQGFPERVLFQSVRMLTSMRRDRLWQKDEPKLTQLVAIGRNLDREEFVKGFEKCVA